MNDDLEFDATRYYWVAWDNGDNWYYAECDLISGMENNDG